MTSIAPRADAMPAREVPLGGLRSMNVQRALPQRALPTIGAWCFLDRFGPQRTTMRVEPHPHMGLQTVTWPLAGEVRHRDSLGSDVVLRAGQLNLVTAGAGVAHSEYSLGDGDADGQPELDALQLWVALPEATRHGERSFERHESLPSLTLAAQNGADADVTVVMGTFAGVTSPATTHTPPVGAEIRVAPGSSVGIPLDPTWEHALVFLLGGEPFADDLVVWWNFVGRSHEEIVEARDSWEAGTERFGSVDGHGDVRVPAPPMPSVRLTPRSRRA